jgi:hypothetical protein
MRVKTAWHNGTRGEPMPIALEFDAKHLILDAQISISPAPDCLRHDGLHFLCDYADIGCRVAVVTEPIEADPTIELPEQGNVVLESQIGPTPATATSTASSATTKTTASAPTTKATATTSRAGEARTASTAHAGVTSGTL